MNTKDPNFELIRRHCDGEATPEESARLESQLREDGTFREAYVRYLNLDSALSSGVALGISQSSAPVKTRRWQRWRPLTAAAAGIAFGILSASVVWACAVPIVKRSVERTVAILTEGFENPQGTPHRGFPKRAGEWWGDLSAPLSNEAGVAPLEGNFMTRLIPVPSRNFSYAWRIIDLADYPALAPEETRQLEVTAFFNTPAPALPVRYQVRLAAFSQEPSAVREIWNNEPLLFDTVLQHVGRNVRVKPGETGWQKTGARLEIPPGTRSIVISLAAGEVDSTDSPGKHYLDDVRASFIITKGNAE